MRKIARIALDANKQLKSEDWIASTHPEYRGAWSAATVEEYTASLTRDLELYKRCLATADKALDAVCNTIPCPPGYNAVQIMQLLGDLRESREKIAQLETELASVRAASTGTGWNDAWLAGRAAAVTRLLEEVESWEQESTNNDISAGEAQFIERRIGQLKTHIAQIREIPLPAPPVASQKGKEEQWLTR
jgi:hypothetical protein